MTLKLILNRILIFKIDFFISVIYIDFVILLIFRFYVLIKQVSLCILFSKIKILLNYNNSEIHNAFIKYYLYLFINIKKDSL